MDSPTTDVTSLLVKWREGEAAAFEQLMPLVYEELRRLARHHLRRERDDHTLHTTDLVHEAYLNLVGKEVVPWQNRTHFFAVAAHAMRHILIDYARRRNRLKRGGGQMDLKLDHVEVFSENNIEDLLSLDQAMTKLEVFDERLCRIVECRYFGGLSIAETAEVLSISSATVKRDWQVAKAWLRRAMVTDHHSGD